MLYAIDADAVASGRRDVSVRRRPTAIGNAFLGDYVLPFEVASLVLLAALIGAIVISRHETTGGSSAEKRRATAMGGGITLNHFLVLSLIIFSLGLVLRADAAQRDRHPDGRRADSQLRQHQLSRVRVLRRRHRYDGQIFAIFVIMLAAAEAVIGLAVILAIYQNFQTIDVDATETLSG